MAAVFIFGIPSLLLITNNHLSALMPRCSQRIGSPRRDVAETKLAPNFDGVTPAAFQIKTLPENSVTRNSRAKVLLRIPRDPKGRGRPGSEQVGPSLSGLLRASTTLHPHMPFAGAGQNAFVRELSRALPNPEAAAQALPSRRQKNPASGTRQTCSGYPGAYGKWDHNRRGCPVCYYAGAPSCCEAVKNEVKKNLSTIIAMAFVASLFVLPGCARKEAEAPRPTEAIRTTDANAVPGRPHHGADSHLLV